MPRRTRLILTCSCFSIVTADSMSLLIIRSRCHALQRMQTQADLSIFSMFVRRGQHKRGPPQAGQARKCQTTAQHFLGSGASLWRVATFECLLGATRHSLPAKGYVRRIAQSEIYDVTERRIHGTFLYIDVRICEGPTF